MRVCHQNSWEALEPCRPMRCSAQFIQVVVALAGGPAGVLRERRFFWCSSFIVDSKFEHLQLRPWCWGGHSRQAHAIVLPNRLPYKSSRSAAKPPRSHPTLSAVYSQGRRVGGTGTCLQFAGPFGRGPLYRGPSGRVAQDTGPGESPNDQLNCFVRRSPALFGAIWRLLFFQALPLGGIPVNSDRGTHPY
jgi:hypothetical protein